MVSGPARGQAKLSAVIFAGGTIFKDGARPPRADALRRSGLDDFLFASPAEVHASALDSKIL